ARTTRTLLWLTLLLPAAGYAQVRVERAAFAGWPNCYRISNGRLELIATTDIGPRIMSIRLDGGPNLFYVREDFAGKSGGAEWRNYGGHRLWHAPEEKSRTYEADNDPILPSQIEALPDGVRLTSEAGRSSGISKSIEIRMDPQRARVTVTHRLRNHGLWAVELAPWAISVMAPDGFAISPLPSRFHPDRLLPNRTLALWPYTDLRDDRYSLGTNMVMLRHRAGIEAARERAKIGVANDDGWCAYARQGQLFIKRFRYVEGAVYPDRGSSVELFTNNRMLELETLAPLVKLAPGATVDYEERWELHANLPLRFGDEEQVRSLVLPLVKQGQN
ncbi:MAG: DUF4380 domain-containing protein, partial [Acidobacteriota bacterium]